MTTEVPVRPAMQGAMFPVEFEYGPGALHLVIRPHRLPRGKCKGCGKRRVLFAFGISDVVSSPPVCRQCLWSATR
jgi:hypothetical protein